MEKTKTAGRKVNKRKFEKMVKAEFTRKEVAEYFKVSVEALNRWCKANYDGSTFAEYKANLSGKILADDERTGRPTKEIEVDYNEVKKIASLGLTAEEIANWLNISLSTLYKNKNENELFSKAIDMGRVQADAKVVQSMYQRAIGYSHKETHISSYRGEITQTELTRHYPPDTSAGVFWLSNRRPQDWKDKKEIDIKDITVFDIFNEFDGEDES